MTAKFCRHYFSCLQRQQSVKERLNHNNDKMNTQLYHIKCYSFCFFFLFLEQNCSAFAIEILIIVIKKSLFLFLFFLYATIMLVYLTIEIFQKIQFRKTATWMIPTGQFPPGKFPHRKIPTQDNSHLENSHSG